MILNPFYHLIKSRKYPASYMVGSSLWNRLKDTFQVFYGDFYENELGILDYAFPFPRILYAAFLQGGNQEPEGFILNASLKLAQATFIALSAVKFLAASALTIATTPFIGIAHILFNIKTRIANKKIRNLNVRDVDVPCRWKESPKFLEERRLGYFSSDRYIARLISVHKSEDNADIYYSHGSFYPKADIIFGLFELEPTLRESTGPLLSIIEITPQNSKGIKALLETNSFFATQDIEEQSSKQISLFDRVEEKIKTPSNG